MIAETFARIFYRNAINIGLPIIECPEAAKGIDAGDEVEVDFDSGLDFLTVTLPSGRRLFYAQPHLVKDRWGRDSLGYYGVNQTTKRWMPMKTYGGKLTENIVQAIARDCLAEAVERLETAGIPVVFHIHDARAGKLAKGGRYNE